MFTLNFLLTTYTQIHTLYVVWRIFILFDQYFFHYQSCCLSDEEYPTIQPTHKNTHTHIVIKSLFLFNNDILFYLIEYVNSQNNS